MQLYLCCIYPSCELFFHVHIKFQREGWGNINFHAFIELIGENEEMCKEMDEVMTGVDELVGLDWERERWKDKNLFPISSELHCFARSWPEAPPRSPRLKMNWEWFDPVFPQFNSLLNSKTHTAGVKMKISTPFLQNIRWWRRKEREKKVTVCIIPISQLESGSYYPRVRMLCSCRHTDR